MKEFFALLKKGNKSAFLAAIVNTIISIAKGIAFLLTGNVAMFAETMHSIGDAANQFFVFIGSALSKKEPTERFPNGFGRLVNLVLLGAVLVVGIMSYETIKEGFHHIFHPAGGESDLRDFIINIAVLGIAISLEFFVLLKASKEVLHETHNEAKGLLVLPKALSLLGKAKPATKLVFLEDSVATLGGILALSAVLISYFTPFHQAEGIASVLIGIMMFFVVGKVFLDNAAGALGEADEDTENAIKVIALRHALIKDVNEVIAIKEGEEIHVEITVEVDPTLTLAQIDDIREELKKEMLMQKNVTDVAIRFDEDDKITTHTTINQSEED